MNILEIEQRILEEKIPTDFVAICMTNWHLSGVFAFLDRLYETEKRVLSGFIVISKHVHTGYSINPALTNCPPYINAEFCFLDENRGKIDIRKLFKAHKHNDGRFLYIISANTPWWAMACQCSDHYDRTIRLVVVDEGLSSYFGRLHWIRQQLFVEKSLSKSISLIGKYFAKDILKLILGYKEEKFMLLNVKRGSCTPNFSVIKYYKNVVSLKKQTLSFSASSDYAIFLTQPLAEDGLIDDEPLFDFYCHIASILKKAGIELYFKTHPREKNIDAYQNYHLNLIEDTLSAEEFVFSVKEKPHFILGLYTTSLVSLNLFYDMETVSLNKLFMDMTLPKELHRILCEFNSLFKNIVNIPDSNDIEKKIIK